MSKTEEKTVGEVLNTLRNSWNMVVLVGEDGYIYIARSREHLEQLQRENKAATIQKKAIVNDRRSASLPVKKNFTLTGEVLDNRSAESIPYATVSVRGTSNYAVTDANGRITLTKVPADTCTIVVDYLGYLPAAVELSPTGYILVDKIWQPCMCPKTFS